MFNIYFSFFIFRKQHQKLSNKSELSHLHTNTRSNVIYLKCIFKSIDEILMEKITCLKCYQNDNVFASKTVVKANNVDNCLLLLLSLLLLQVPQIHFLMEVRTYHYIITTDRKFAVVDYPVYSK